MTTEERVKNLEGKLNELIELLKYSIQVDEGIDIKNANILLANLDQLKEDV